MRHITIHSLTILLALTLLMACSGGADAPATGTAAANTTPASGGSAVKTSGVMTRGSVIVNGITFSVNDDTAISVDDSPDQAETELENGMVVRVIGTRNDDNETGVADTVKAENEVQGQVEEVDTVNLPNSMTVLGQNVLTDDLTVFANVGGLDTVNAGDFVEVHGLRDATGNIRATRVEVLGGAPAETELRGTVQNLFGTRFFIQDLEIDFGAANIEPAGSTVGEGDQVEVKGLLFNGIMTATEIQIEDLVDTEFEPAEDDEMEIEGYVDGFVPQSVTFRINSVSTVLNDATTFVNGARDDLMDNVFVEAEGTFSGGNLIAEAIRFKRGRVELTSRITTVNDNGFTMLGQNVITNTLTEAEDVLTVGQRYMVRGYEDSGGNIIAERVRLSGGDDDRLKAPVQSFDMTAGEVTLLDIPIDLSNPLMVFQNRQDAFIDADQFFNDLDNGDIIRVRGFHNSDSNTFIAQEASLEND